MQNFKSQIEVLILRKLDNYCSKQHLEETRKLLFFHIYTNLKFMFTNINPGQIHF